MCPRSLRDPVRFVVRDPDGDGPEEAIIAGFPDDTFRPRTPISRAASIRMLTFTAPAPHRMRLHDVPPGAP